jgi:hypothetical protein
LEKLFVADARTESGEAEDLLVKRFNGGVGLSYEHRKTRKQCKTWFNSRAKKGKQNEAKALQLRKLSAMRKEDKTDALKAAEKAAKAM